MSVKFCLASIWLAFVCFGQAAMLGNVNWGSSWFQENRANQLDTSNHERSIRSVYSQQAFQDADTLLQTLEEARVCKREATLRLISTPTCEDALQEPRRDDIEMMMDLYAIELAKCEIESASVKLPASCQLELPAASVEKNIGPVIKTNLRQCLAALHSKPQWWTSYSNHRRDGYQWCLTMKPGFDHNEHVKVWKNVYSAMDVSVDAIKNSFLNVLSWCQESKSSLNDLFTAFTKGMEAMQSAAEKNVELSNTRLQEAYSLAQDRLDTFHDGLTDTERQLSNVQSAAVSSQSHLQAIQDDLDLVSKVQRMQLDQLKDINTEALSVQIIIKETRSNITAEQQVMMERLVTIHEVSEQLGNSFIAANHHMQNINLALASWKSSYGLGSYLNWILMIIGIGCVNRKVAVCLALVLLLLHDLSSYFHGISLSSIYATFTYNHGYDFERMLRLLGIIGLFWYIIATRSQRNRPVLPPYWQNSGNEGRQHYQYRSDYHIRSPQPSLPYYSPKVASSHSRYPSIRRFDREQSSPL